MVGLLYTDLHCNEKGCIGEHYSTIPIAFLDVAKEKMDIKIGQG